MHRISLSVIQIKLYTHQIYDIYDIIIITHFHYCSLLNTLIPRFVLYWGNWIENKRKCGIKKEWKEGKRERRKKRGRGGKEKIKTMENILHRSVYYLLYIYIYIRNEQIMRRNFQFSIPPSLSFSLSSLQLIPRYGRIRSTATATYPFPFFHFARNFFPLN